MVPLKSFNLIKNVEYTVIFLTWKVFNSDTFSIASYKQEMRIGPVTFAEKPKMKIKSWKKQKHGYLHDADLIRQSFKGAVIT